MRIQPYSLSMLTIYLRMWGVFGLGSFSTNLWLLRMCISRQSIAKSLIGNLDLCGITVVHQQRWPYPNPMDFGLKIESFLSIKFATYEARGNKLLQKKDGQISVRYQSFR